MKVVTYNIQYGLGRDGTFDLNRIARSLQGADIIALQEVERFWQRSGLVDQVEVLTDLLPEYRWVYGPNVDLDATYHDESGRLVNRRRQFGNMVLSRYPIVSSRNFPLPKRGLINQHSVQKGILETVIDTPLGALRVYCVHLCHLCAQTRLPQIDTIQHVLSNAPMEGGAWNGDHPEPGMGWTEGEMPVMPDPCLLMGDMNFTNLDPEYEALLGPLAEGYGRLINPHGLIDSWVASGRDENQGFTREHRRIDHCFVSASLRNRVASTRVDTQSTGSDHCPLWITFKQET